MSEQFQVLAPLNGITVMLKDIPDPVFAGGLLGDGLAIDPTSGSLKAPIDGQIVHIHPSRHALTIEHESGTQLLIHVGLDTVKLRGEFFETKVSVGEQVISGQILIEFDLDQVARKAKSMISPIVILKNEISTSQVDWQLKGEVVAGRDVLFKIANTGNGSASVYGETTTMAGAFVRSKKLVVADTTGLHARPAALIAEVAQKFHSNIEIEYSNQRNNAKSILGIISLEIPGQSEFCFLASGTDGALAIVALENLFENSVNDTLVANVQAATGETRKKEAITKFIGETVSNGLVAGHVLQFDSSGYRAQESIVENVEIEEAKLKAALAAAASELSNLEKKLLDCGTLDQTHAAIFATHRALLSDPDLVAMSIRNIKSQMGAINAWQNSVGTYIQQIESLKNVTFASRAADLRDVNKRVMRQLTGSKEINFQEISEDTLLIAEELGPSEIIAIHKSKIVGLCMIAGGKTSHVAILAKSLGIPTVTGLVQDVLDIQNGDLAVLDATGGTLILNPTAQEITRIKTLKKELAVQFKKALAESKLPAQTLDRRRVQVAANITTEIEAIEALQFGAEGVGLLRTEMFFMQHQSEPSEEMQFQYYKSLAEKFGSLPLIVRTLDVGGDKPLPYISIQKESNPFLGERGIRFSLNEKNMFTRQIRAILRASVFGNIQIMFPMISTLEELLEAKDILKSEAQSLSLAIPPTGMMMEVPSAVLIADRLAKEVQFFSIGSNDLTQYVMAMDRTNSALSKKADSLHPAVLKMISMIVVAARKENIWVGVCGGVAADIKALPVLIGLGVEELSVGVSSLAEAKSMVRKLRYSDCVIIADRCLSKTTAEEVRELL